MTTPDHMATRPDETQIPEPQFREISRLQAFGLRLWGPADSHDNPLYGTKYDPRLRQQRQHESLEYRRQRWEQRKARMRDMTMRARHRHA